MLHIVKEGEYTGILGDCSAKTGTGKLLDYVETTDVDDDGDLIQYMNDYENFEKSGVSLSRNSTCNCIPND